MNVELEGMWVVDDDIDVDDVDDDVDVDVDADVDEEKVDPTEFIVWEWTDLGFASTIACIPLSCTWPEEKVWKLASLLLVVTFYA